MRRTLLFFALAVVFTNVHADRIFYVAITGDNTKPGTEQQPWRTLNYAIKCAGPGDTVYVRAGAYFEGGEIWFRPGQGGTAGAWKTFKAFPGEDVVLETRLLIEASHVRVQGFRMASGKSIITRRNGTTPVSHVEVINNRLAGYYRYGAIEIAGDDILVEGNEIALDGAGSTLDHGIYVHYGQNKIIRRNRITGAPGYGIHVYEEDKYPASPDIDGVIIEGNYIANSVARAGIILTCAQGVKIANVTIRQNVITKNAQGAIKIASDRVSKVSILNNTIVGNRDQSIVVEGAREINLLNNIILSAVSHIGISNSTQVVINTNLYGPGASDLRGGVDLHPISGDPLFVNATQNNFRLNAGSPTIDTGIKLGLRYTGVAPDLGAFEYGIVADVLDERETAPQGFGLAPNFPNPFNPRTQINYWLPAATRLQLVIYNLVGEEVKTLVDEIKNSGVHEAIWDGTDTAGHPVSSGVYICHLEAGAFHASRKLMLAR